jgi:hypothetical protein
VVLLRKSIPQSRNLKAAAELNVKLEKYMSNDARLEPLEEWNKLARENTENAIVSSMFEAYSKTSESLEQFSMWLLIGAAAIGSFIIVNSDKVTSLVGNPGYSWCGAFLCASCFFGVLSKIYALRCKICNEMASAIRSTFAAHLASHEEEEEKIQESAGILGITLETGVRIERIIGEFYKSFPKIISWSAFRFIRKNEGNPQIGYLLLISNVNQQSLHTVIQALAFLGFLISGFVFAA